jgi:flagellar basal-body rod modification protein FlgD
MVTAVSNTASTQSASTTDAAALTTNYTTFLNLLTAQIKNQDPLSPMDTTAWTAQLVQYSSVEQQLKGNQYLEALTKQSTQSNMNAAVSYIGKTVTADQDVAGLKDSKAEWQYALSAEATKATLTVKDSDGTVVWSGDAPDLTSGAHSFTWDGKDSSGKAVPEGQYTLSIAASNASSDIDAAVGITGIVTSVANSDGTILLKVGNTSVDMTTVTSVS